MGTDERTGEIRDHGGKAKWIDVGGDLEPTFIECNEKGLRVYENNGKHFEVPVAQITAHSKLKARFKK